MARKRPDIAGELNPQWRGDAASHSAIHHWLQKHHPRKGVCEECGAVGRTEHAFLKHPEPHTRNCEDYAELCVSCHRALDDPDGHRVDAALAARGIERRQEAA